MAEQDKRFIQIKLDDAIIKANDENGVEKLRLGVKIEGHDVLIRFPAYGDWDFYIQDLAKLLMILSRSIKDVELNIDLVAEEHFADWAAIVGEVIKFKSCRELIDKIFFNYLRPCVPTLESDDVKGWLRKNMDISHLFYIFVSIMHVEEWLKKKTHEVEKTTFPSLIQPSSTDTSPKKPESLSTQLEPGQSFKFD